jgi:hypothetical protein
MGQLPIPQKLLKKGIRDMLRISDARMSGTSYGACVLHVTPESHVGGPLALVRDGDRISIDIEARRVDVLISDEEMAKRKAAWKQPAAKFTRGYGVLYLKHIQQADKGCDFDFLEPGHTQARPAASPKSIDEARPWNSRRKRSSAARGKHRDALHAALQARIPQCLHAGRFAPDQSCGRKSRRAGVHDAQYSVARRPRPALRVREPGAPAAQGDRIRAPGHVLVLDCRGEKRVASGGQILTTRLQKRGAAGSSRTARCATAARSRRWIFRSIAQAAAPR